jgi:hypothetical protein
MHRAFTLAGMLRAATALAAARVDSAGNLLVGSGATRATRTHMPLLAWTTLGDVS